MESAWPAGRHRPSRAYRPGWIDRAKRGCGRRWRSRSSRSSRSDRSRGACGCRWRGGTDRGEWACGRRWCSRPDRPGGACRCRWRCGTCRGEWARGACRACGACGACGRRWCSRPDRSGGACGCRWRGGTCRGEWACGACRACGRRWRSRPHRSGGACRARCLPEDRRRRCDAFSGRRQHAGYDLLRHCLVPSRGGTPGRGRCLGKYRDLWSRPRPGCDHRVLSLRALDLDRNRGDHTELRRSKCRDNHSPCSVHHLAGSIQRLHRCRRRDSLSADAKTGNETGVPIRARRKKSAYALPRQSGSYRQGLLKQRFLRRTGLRPRAEERGAPLRDGLGAR